MNTETEFLRAIAEDIVARQDPDRINEPKADHRLLVEARRLEKAITVSLRSIDNFTQRDTFHNDTLARLVDICDLLFDAHHRVSPDTRVLLDLLTIVKRILPGEISPLLRLPKAFVKTQKELIKAAWEGYDRTLQGHKIDPKLISIAGIPFQRFIDGKEKLYWGDFTWLKGYIAKLDAADWVNADCNSQTEALMSLLIGRDFNDDRFYIYCKKYIGLRIQAVSGKRNKLLAYAECEKLVLQDTQTGMPSFDGHANSVNTRLIKWIREEIDFVDTHERERPLSKFEFKWNVETIAFFFKLLWDHKVFGKVSLEPLSEQIAANCSSIGKDEFQATTIFSRFYVKDKEVLKAVENVLREMLEDVERFL